jgi:hypothetical protein
MDANSFLVCMVSSRRALILTEVTVILQRLEQRPLFLGGYENVKLTVITLQL